MKKIYNVCFSSHDEVLFRDEEDHARFINCYAHSLTRTESLSYCDVEMSDHGHYCIATDNLTCFSRSLHTSYSKYFNNKYKRHGRLGDHGYYAIEIYGLNHFLAAICYDLRNAVHHGVTPTPYMYPYSSVNCYFREALGKPLPKTRSMTKSDIRRTLPRYAKWSDAFVMDSSGVFLRDSFTETRVVERHFASARSFLYYMNRLSGEEWERLQSDDRRESPLITLELIEMPMLTVKGTDTGSLLTRLKSNEYGRFSLPELDDMRLCSLIDHGYLSDFKASSIYELSTNDRIKIAADIRRKHRVSEAQLQRCLILTDTSAWNRR